MMPIFESDSETPVAECKVKPQKGGYLVVRVVDEEGRYRRVKFQVVERQGIKGILVDDRAVALLLPDFRWLQPPKEVEEGKKEKKSSPKGKIQLAMGKTARSVSQTGHEERRGRITPNLAKTEATELDLNAMVLARILRKLKEMTVVLAEDLTLPAHTVVNYPLVLTHWPEGRVFFQPAQGITVQLPLVLQRADLGNTEEILPIPIYSSEEKILPKGTLLGVVEVRSPSELPEGMRQKVFQSHFQSSLAAASS